MGYRQCPYVVIRHRDRQHQHCHIAAIKIDANGQTVSESGDFKRAAAVARQLEAEFQLTKIDQENKTMTPEARAFIVKRLEASSNEAAKKLADSIPGIKCADKELTDDRRRNYKRQLLEEHYQAAIGAAMLDDLQYIKRTPAGLIITLRPQGRIIDNGDKVTAERMGNEEAARRIVQLALIKKWERVEFFGNAEFIRLAMAEALSHGIEVHPRDEAQAEILQQVKAARKGDAGAAAAFVPAKADIANRLASFRSQRQGEPKPNQPKLFNPKP
jgi:hypothetical protein